MGKFLRFIQLIVQLSRQAEAFLGESDKLLRQQSPEELEMLRGHCRRIVQLAVFFPILYGVIFPIAIPYTALYIGLFHSPNGAFRATALGLLFSVATIFFYVFAGVAAGCLLVPDEFLDNPVGQKWLELIGSKSHTGARIICVVMVLAGMLIAVVLGLGQLWMMKGPAFQ